jgi:hypothetical protein
MPEASEDKRDKATFERAAADLINALKKAQIRGDPLKFRRQPQLEEVNSGGWSVTIATMESGAPALEVFFDRLAGGKVRRFWFGFFATKPTPISKVIEVSPSRSSRQIEDADVEKVSDRYWSLKKPLQKLEAKKPIPEQYFMEDLFYFSILCSNHTPATSERPGPDRAAPIWVLQAAEP